MSAGLVHGTGGPASTTPSVFDVPSVMSARRTRGPTTGPSPAPAPVRPIPGPGGTPGPDSTGLAPVRPIPVPGGAPGPDGPPTSSPPRGPAIGYNGVPGPANAW